MRVLILAYDFPPLNSIGARRPYSWYTHFPNSDIHPVVITKSWTDSSASIRETVSQTGSSKVTIDEQPQRTLIRVPFNKILPEKLIIRFGEIRFKWFRKLLTFIYVFLSYPISLFDRNILIYREAKKYLKQHPTDYILATGEPFILFKYGHLLSKKFDIPWIADFRDGWYLNHVVAQRKGIGAKCLRKWEYLFEKKYLSTCRFMTSVDPLLTNKLETLHKKKAYLIYNGFEEFLKENEANPNTGLPLVLSHSGTIYPGHRLEILLQVIHDLDTEGKISPQTLQVNFWGIDYYPDQRSRLINFSKRTAPYLVTSQRMPQHEVLLKNISSDFLISFTEENQPVIPAKTYDYLASKRPILVIPGDHSILSSLINDLRAGISISSSQHLKSFLMEKIALKENRRPVFTFRLDETKAMFYTRKNQASQLALILWKDAVIDPRLNK